MLHESCTWTVITCASKKMYVNWGLTSTAIPYDWLKMEESGGWVPMSYQSHNQLTIKTINIKMTNIVVFYCFISCRELSQKNSVREHNCWKHPETIRETISARELPFSFLDTQSCDLSRHDDRDLLILIVEAHATDCRFYMLFFSCFGLFVVALGDRCCVNLRFLYCCCFSSSSSPASSSSNSFSSSSWGGPTWLMGR